MAHPEQYFDNKSNVDVLYFTSDNLSFFHLHKAQEHAHELGDNIVRDMTRDEVLAAISEMQLEDWDQPEETQQS